MLTICLQLDFPQRYPWFTLINSRDRAKIIETRADVLRDSNLQKLKKSDLWLDEIDRAVS